MLKGVHAGDNGFLVQLDRVEQRISTNSNQITSGIRVSQAQDDPFAVQSILSLQSQLDQIDQVQTNLNVAKTDADAADNAISTTGTILDQLVSIASQGASDITTQDSRTILSLRAAQLTQQIVGIANTQVGSRFIFGGDTPDLPPLTANAAAPNYSTVTAGAATASTKLLRNVNGATQPAGLTASQIFNDSTSSILSAGYSLAQALAANNPAGATTAIQSLKDASAVLSKASVFYGNVQTWIETASTQGDSQKVNLQGTLSGLRDVDVPTAITRLTSDQTALQAALSAHASLSQKTLFDYFA